MDDGLMTPREMDAYIAERCFGKIVLKAHHPKDAYHNGEELIVVNPGAELVYGCKAYTESMTDAWPVFEWLLENHPWKYQWEYHHISGSELLTERANISLTVSNQGKPRVVVDNDNAGVWDYEADTFPMAICKAAVAACEEIAKSALQSQSQAETSKTNGDA